MKRLISWNVNGIRAASQNPGFKKIFETLDADFISLQEIKCFEEQLDFWQRQPNGYQGYFFSAEKPGYSGVAIFTKHEPLTVTQGLGDPTIDREGRVLQMELKDFVLVNTYFPNSQRDHARLDYKLHFCRAMESLIDDWRKKNKEVILCGDLNIAHQEIDLKNPKANMNNAGFLPQERQWMSRFLTGSWGMFDVFRDRNPHATDQYTWWSYRPGIRERNIGWRLDYHLVSQGLMPNVRDVYHLPDVFGSDHCPVGIDLDCG